MTARKALPENLGTPLWRARRRFVWAGFLAGAVLAVGLVLAARGAPAGETPPPGDSRPITKVSGPVGDLLKKWWAQGTAAGNDGDRYDNRDGGHSGLDLGPYPQLEKIEYTPQDKQRGLHWALQSRVVPGVVFGNSSTSSGPTTAGSNPRSAYSHPRGLGMLYAQYRNSNLYIYPEHRDYDPGHNGAPAGYGDLYPTNTPYLIISQGSSGSDRPFMRVVPFVLAAFRPQVKRKLVEAGLLMPTVQMVLRTCAKGLAGPDEYLTGKAHPTVFDGKVVDDLKMVQAAHAITLEDIPPMVQLRATEEDEPVRGRDFFDAYAGERLADTPAVIARVYRSWRPVRRLVVSAQASYDVNGRPLRFHWAVLRGDASRVQLKPLNADKSVCEITVPWQERRPIAPGADMESSRVDIGVFVHNGAHYSAPGFVTVLCLDDEARTYGADGRIIEMGYGCGAAEVTVRDWPAALDLYGPAAESPGARLLRQGLSAETLAALADAAGECRKAKADAEAAQPAPPPPAEDILPDTHPGAQPDAAPGKPPASSPKAPKDAAKGKDAAKDKAAPPVDPKVAQKMREAVDEAVNRKRPALKGSVRDFVEGTLRALARSVTFYPDHAKDVVAAIGTDAGRRGAVKAARERLGQFGLLRESSGDRWELTPLSEGRPPAAERLTAYEKALVGQFNAEVLGRVFFGGPVTVAYKRNYVDPRIAVPKSWRDVYHYASDGQCLGWTRYDGSRRGEFNAQGLKVVEKDALGRCIKAQAVRYEPAGPDKGPPTNPWSATLKEIVVSDVTEYEYAGDEDRRGKVKEPAGK